jgi:exopolysaccharide biosynthesis polyprenyl glycosylphosphotransferase
VEVGQERVPSRASARHEAFLPIACLATDIVMLAAATVVQLTAPAGAARAAVGWPLVFSLITLLLFAGRGVYAPRLRLRLLDEARGIVAATATAAMALIAARVLIADPREVGTETVHLWLFATVLLAAGRTVLLTGEARARRRGETLRPALIVGAGKIGRLTAGRLLGEPELGLRPIGFLDDEPLLAEDDPVTLPLLGESSDLEHIISEHEVRHVIVAFSRSSHAVLLGMIRRCNELGVPVSIMPRLFELGGNRQTVERLGSLRLIAVGATNPEGWQFKVKYVVERVVAAIALLLVLPLFALATIAIKLTMGGPVFFRQRRVGACGREFDMLKLRTMGRTEEDEESDFDWALEQLASNGADRDERAIEQSVAGSDRRTRLGRALRRFSLDELPQLWNVVRGEMSLVGPRPERVRYVQRFEQSIYRYGDRHRVRSGITGWAQVHGLRGRTSLRDRVEWDNYYIENWSFWLDVRIILMTIACVLRGQHDENWWH